MSEKAMMSNRWRLRLGLIAAAVTFFGLWFLYDGFVKYPAQMQAWEVEQQLRQEHQGGAWLDYWDAAVEEHNLTQEPARHSDADILIQRVIAFALLPLGAVFIFYFARSLTAWIGMDEDGLHTSSGKQARFDAVQQIDMSRWDRKGIAVVHFESPSGSMDRITLDDWKYDTEPINKMMSELKQRTGMGLDDAAVAQDAADGSSPAQDHSSA